MTSTTSRGTVAVTGGSGRLGRFVVNELANAGWTVHNFDVVPYETDSISFTKIDLGNLGQVVEAFTTIDELHDGVDAVVHLAAIPGATKAANTATFDNNLIASNNVFTAARIAGITNIVWASSETLLGYPFKDTVPPYVPMDEDYAPQGNVAYSLVKVLEEEIARQLTRRYPTLKMVGLRFSYISGPDYTGIEQLEANPLEQKWNMWAYIDVRDAARAVRLALDADITGFEAINIAAADTVMQRPTADLLREYFPDVPIRRDLVGTVGPTDISKADRLLGWKPEHTWREGN